MGEGSLPLGDEAADAIERALDALAPPPERRSAASTELWLVLSERTALDRAPPPLSYSLAELESIASALDQIEAHLWRVHVAMVTTAGAASRGQMLRLAFASTCEVLAGHVLDWDADRMIDAPLLRVYARKAVAVRQVVAALRSDATAAARSRGEAPERFIVRLAAIWRRFTDTEPSAAENSSRQAYRSPFLRFVDAAWSIAASSPVPSASTVRRVVMSNSPPAEGSHLTECHTATTRPCRVQHEDASDD